MLGSNRRVELGMVAMVGLVVNELLKVMNLSRSNRYIYNFLAYLVHSCIIQSYLAFDHRTGQSVLRVGLG